MYLEVGGGHPCWSVSEAFKGSGRKTVWVGQVCLTWFCGREDIPMLLYDDYDDVSRHWSLRVLVISIKNTQKFNTELELIRRWCSLCPNVLEMGFRFW